MHEAEGCGTVPKPTAVLEGDQAAWTNNPAGLTVNVHMCCAGLYWLMVQFGNASLPFSSQAKNGAAASPAQAVKLKTCGMHLKRQYPFLWVYREREREFH